MNNYSWFIGIITAWKGPLLNPTTFGSLSSSKIVEPSVIGSTYQVPNVFVVEPVALVV